MFSPPGLYFKKKKKEFLGEVKSLSFPKKGGIWKSDGETQTQNLYMTTKETLRAACKYGPNGNGYFTINFLSNILTPRTLC